MGIWDWVLLGVLAASVAVALIGVLRQKRRCGGGCAHCPYRDGCQRKPKQ